MTDNLTSLCKKAAEIIHSFPKDTRIRVISHYDADGISAAGIICKALYRERFNFHATLMRNPFDKGLERVSKEDNKLIIFCDMGSGQIETIEKIDCKTIIIDHHQILKEKTKSNVFQINANLCGINGNYEACGASLTFAVAKALNPKNEDLSPLAIAGVTGDKQYIGGIHGYNKSILDDAVKKGYLHKKNGLKLHGETLSDALFYTVDPYYSGISGDKKGINSFLKRIGLNMDIKPSGLNDEQLKQLHSFLLFTLIKKGCEKNILDTVIRERYTSEMLFDCELEHFADLLDSCGKGGNRGLGLSTALGDKSSFEQAEGFEKEYKKRILDELLRLEKEGFKEKKSYLYFYSKDSSLGGVIGGIAMNYLIGREKPLLSLVRNDDEIHVSCRVNQYLVNKGLDLGVAMKKASSKLGGHGGGHAIASGATIKIEKEDEFLKIVDDIIFKQLKEV